MSKGHWERNCRNRFGALSSSKIDRFTSNQDQHDHRPILHIACISPVDMLYFCDIWLSHLSHYHIPFVRLVL